MPVRRTNNEYPSCGGPDKTETGTTAQKGDVHGGPVLQDIQITMKGGH